MNWKRTFDDPIPMPDGTIITTIGEAAEHATSLPRKVGNTEAWQGAAKALQQAAEHGGPFIFTARIIFYKAVYGDEPPPIGNPKNAKGHKWGKRKLARDR